MEKGSALNDFGHNLALALAEGSVTHKTSGLVAAIYPCYARHLEREIERKRQAERKNEWFGEIETETMVTRGKNKGTTKKTKPRYELELTVLKITYRESDYGTTAIHKMLDSEGRTFTWFGSTDLRDEKENKDVREGTTFTATWSVKKHSEYKGFKETILTRPSGVAVVS